MTLFKPLTSREAILLSVFAFVLMSIQGYLLQSAFVQTEPYLMVLLAALPALIMLLKVVMGTVQPGKLTPVEGQVLMFIALVLTAIGLGISAVTANPVYLFLGGLLGAVVSGLRAFLGTQTTTASPIAT